MSHEKKVMMHYINSFQRWRN